VRIRLRLKQVQGIKVAARSHKLLPQLLGLLPVKRIDFLAARIADQQG
jgi:hypothetical protein